MIKVVSWDNTEKRVFNGLYEQLQEIQKVVSRGSWHQPNLSVTAAWEQWSPGDVRRFFSIAWCRTRKDDCRGLSWCCHVFAACALQYMGHTMIGRAQHVKHESILFQASCLHAEKKKPKKTERESRRLLHLFGSQSACYSCGWGVECLEIVNRRREEMAGRHVKKLETKKIKYKHELAKPYIFLMTSPHARLLAFVYSDIYTATLWCSQQLLEVTVRHTAFQLITWPTAWLQTAPCAGVFWSGNGRFMAVN